MRSPNRVVLRVLAVYMAVVPAGAALGQESSLPELDTAAVLAQPQYPKINVLELAPGHDRFTLGLPRCWKEYVRFVPRTPGHIETPLYRYADVSGPTRQNVSIAVSPADCGDGRCIAAYNLVRGVDDTAAGFVQYKVWYRVSTDGGATWGDMKPLIQEGPEYSPQHPNRFVTVGKNGFVFALTAQPFTPLRNGTVLMPFYYAPLDARGEYDNPLRTTTFSWLACAIGSWDASRTDLTWEVTGDIRLGAEYTSRGLSEAAAIELEQPGHVLMVLRGSNHVFTGKQRGGNWKVVSSDHGRTWSEVTPFTFSDGEDFYGPAQKSGLIRSGKTGKVYWIGHMSRTRPKGNAPRRPLVIAELDEKQLGLRRETVTIIDDRKPGEPEESRTDFVGFAQDVNTGHILVSLVRSRVQPTSLTAVIEVR